MPEQEIDIVRLGQQGDGEGTLQDGTRAFVPLTLAGDRVRVRPGARRGDGVVATVVDYLDKAPRNSPFCAYFGSCGGCRLQHLPSADYVAWKRDAVAVALRRQGLTPEIAPLLQVPSDSRRRVNFSAVMTQSGLHLGFNAAHSDRIVDIAACPLLRPALNRIIGPLRDVLGGILAGGERADIAVTLLSGDRLDVSIACPHDLDLQARERLAAFADTSDLARLAWRMPDDPPEPVSARLETTLKIADVDVPFPGEGFLQPSEEGEALLRAFVCEALQGAKRVADLYCGIGTFTLPLAKEGAHVLAIDGDQAQADALATAAGRAGLGGRIRAVSRDLRTDPLSVAELNEFDAVVFDPPRAGAKTQVECLADSMVPIVCAVSCNPATLGRDLRILTDGGYRLERVTPVDQFPMTHHVEAVAVLRRG